MKLYAKVFCFFFLNSVLSNTLLYFNTLASDYCLRVDPWKANVHSLFRSRLHENVSPKRQFPLPCWIYTTMEWQKSCMHLLRNAARTENTSIWARLGVGDRTLLRQMMEYNYFLGWHDYKVVKYQQNVDWSQAKQGFLLLLLLPSGLQMVIRITE